MLHRARIGVVAFGMLRGVELLGHQDGRHRAPAELDRRRQPDRSAADHQGKGLSVHRLTLRTSTRGREPAGEKLAAVAQAFLVDAVADAVRHVPLDRHAERGEPARGMEQRLRAESGRPGRRASSSTGGRDLISAASVFRVGVGRHHQQSGIADDRERRRGAPQPHMQRHHGALAEADQRQRRGRKIAARELGVEKAVPAPAPPCWRRSSARWDRGR